jgi:hypothetical protein
MNTKKRQQKMQAWEDARKRHHLSHAQAQMGRELGMNPRKLGKIDNHKQERWKLPLPQFIEELYFKRFGRTAPASIAPRASDSAKLQHQASRRSSDCTQKPEQSSLF